RHSDPTHGQDCEIEDRPLIAGGRKDGYPVTGLHPQGDQTQCRGANLLGRLDARDIGPNAVDQTLKNDKAGIVSLKLEDHGRDVVVLADGKAGGDTVLTHFYDLV